MSLTRKALFLTLVQPKIIAATIVMKNILLICPNHFAAKILNGKLCFLVFACLFCFNNNLLAQAPTISYSSPPVYTVGQTITTLTPSASGVGSGKPVRVANAAGAAAKTVGATGI